MNFGRMTLTLAAWLGFCACASAQGALLQDDGIFHSTITLSGLNVTPTANSASQAWLSTQTGPSSGSNAALNVYLNQFNITSDALAATNGSGGTVYGLAVTYGFGGSNMQGQRVGLSGSVALNSPSSASNAFKIYTGTVGLCQMNSADGGTNTTSGAAGSCLGVYGSSIAASGITNLYEVIGAEYDVSYRPGSSGKFLIGLRIAKWADSVVDASTLNTGIQLINQSGASGWKDYGIVFDSSDDGAGTLFQSGATIIGVKGSASATYGVDFSSVSFSQSAFKTFQWSVTGNGDEFANSITITGAGSPPTNGLAQASANNLSIYTNSLRTANFTADSSAVNYLYFQAKNTGVGPQVSVAGTDSNIPLTLSTKGTGAINFITDLFSTFPTQFSVLHTAGATRYATITGSNGGNPTINTTAGNLAITPSVVVAGSLTATTLTVTAAGPPVNGFALPSSNNVSIYTNSLRTANFTSDASAVNYLWAQAKATGQGPQFSVAGSDSNISMTLGTQGSGSVDFITDIYSTFPKQFSVLHTAGATNYITVTGSNGGNPTLNTSGGNLAVTPPIIGGSYIKTATTTVGSLPSCVSGLKGARHFVTDANSTTFHATATGGGANNMAVVCDGTNWYLN